MPVSDAVLLGPQYRMPNLREAVTSLGAAGPLAVISAGWQEREGELDELAAHVGVAVTDLRLYARTEEIWATDSALAAAARERQARLQELQDTYRLRLGALMRAVEELQALAEDSAAVRQARRSALGDVRRLDRQHLYATAREHAAFEARWRPRSRPSTASAFAAVNAILANSAAVLIAGGHVAVLLNRLRLFDLGATLATRPLIAWSAGAMAVSERVVLFHDHPPQGASHPEVLEAGLGLVAAVVALPHAGARLALEDRLRVGTLARRFAPARCLALDHGSLARWHRGKLVAASDLRRLTRSGRLAAEAA